jgi:hypothetical protein
MQGTLSAGSFSVTSAAPHRSKICFQRLSEIFFCIFDVVANKSFGVVARKLTNIYLLASEKHFEGPFNLYTYIALIC